MPTTARRAKGTTLARAAAAKSHVSHSGRKRAATKAAANKAPVRKTSRAFAPFHQGSLVRFAGKGCFEPGGKEDVYRLVVGGSGTRVVTFEVEGAAQNRTFLYLHGPGGDEIYSGNTSVEAGEPGVLELIVEGGTTLYVRLYPGVEPLEPRGYRVLTSERAADEREPDDEPAGAAALSLGRPLHGLLLSRVPSHPVPTSTIGEVDVDTFRVEVTQAGTLRVDVDEVDPRLRATIHIRGPGVTHEGPPAPEGKAATSRVAVSPGTYLVRIAQGYDHPAVPTVHHREVAPESRGFTYRVTATIE